jgi:hypothetical protein
MFYPASPPASPEGEADGGQVAGSIQYLLISCAKPGLT